MSGTIFSGSPQDLAFLMRDAGQPVTRSAIVEQGWKLNFDTMTNVVDVYINYLRHKVDTGYDRALIRTVRGVGHQIGGNTGATRSAVVGSAVAVYGRSSSSRHPWLCT